MNFLKIVLEKKLKGEIREEGGIFAGLEVSFKDDHTEIWMNENLIEIDKPELVKKAEKYLKKITQGYGNNNSEEDSSNIPRTPLTKWTLKGD